MRALGYMLVRPDTPFSKAGKKTGRSPRRRNSNEPLAQNEATAICAGCAGSADRLPVAAPSAQMKGRLCGTAAFLPLAV